MRCLTEAFTLSVELNHTIVSARDNRESAEFLAHILGLEVGVEWGPFIPVATSNGVTLDFATFPAESIIAQHYAFLISEEEFDASFARIRQAGLTYYADPHRKQPGRSTTTTAAGACTSWIRQVTAWRSSPAPMAGSRLRTEPPLCLRPVCGLRVARGESRRPHAWMTVRQREAMPAATVSCRTVSTVAATPRPPSAMEAATAAQASRRRCRWGSGKRGGSSGPSGGDSRSSMMISIPVRC